MRKMRTAEEMVEYCYEKGILIKKRHSQTWKEHFLIIEEILEENEYAVCCFAALQYVTTSYGDSGNLYAYALTNTRILKSRYGDSSRYNLHVISYKDLNNITSKNILIDTIKSDESADISRVGADSIKRELQPIVEIILKQKSARERANRFTGSVADELMKFKQLRDEGVLTDAEFQKQKDLLLNPGWEEFVVDFEAEEGKED